MTDTKIQIQNRKNNSLVHVLERLFRKETALNNELRIIRSWKREGQIYACNGKYKDYDINWAIHILKNELKSNQSMIKQVRSELVIC